MNNKLIYTVENILTELAKLITNSSSTLPGVILEYYVELQDLSYDLDKALSQTNLSANQAADEIYDIYQDMIDIYIHHIEEEIC